MNEPGGRIEILEGPQALARHVAEWITTTALASKPMCRVSLSGGSTPKALYELLAADPYRSRFPWTKVCWYWGDERFVPPDHPESNFRMAREAMLSKAPVPAANIHPIPTDGDPEDAARRYEDALQAAYGAPTLDPSRPLFDIMLLGLGADGHTASLFTASDLARTGGHLAIPVHRPDGMSAVSVTPQLLAQVEELVFVVVAEGKRDAVRALEAGDAQLTAWRAVQECVQVQLWVHEAGQA
jgi:6-phosphogluconolactonase